MVRKFKQDLDGSENLIVLTVIHYDVGQGPIDLKPDLRIWRRPEVRPPPHIAARFESEDEGSRSDDSTGAGGGGNGQGKTKCYGSRSNKQSKNTTARTSPTENSSPDVKEKANTKQRDQSGFTNVPLEQPMADVSLEDGPEFGIRKGKGNRRGTRKGKGRGSQNQSSSSSGTSYPTNEEEPIKKSLMEASKIFNRLRTDPDFNFDDFMIGYIDRFKDKLQWKPAGEWDMETTAAAFIPEWKIQQFKNVRTNTVIWDKEKRLDLITKKEGYYQT